MWVMPKASLGPLKCLLRFFTDLTSTPKYRRDHRAAGASLGGHGAAEVPQLRVAPAAGFVDLAHPPVGRALQEGDHRRMARGDRDAASFRRQQLRHGGAEPAADADAL